MLEDIKREILIPNQGFSENKEDTMIRKFLRNMLGEDFTHNNQTLMIVNYGIIIALFVFSAIMLRYLPKEIPMQWNSDGSVNYSLPSVIGVWMPPAIMLVVNFFMIKQERINVITTGAYLIAFLLVVIYYIAMI